MRGGFGNPDFKNLLIEHVHSGLLRRRDASVALAGKTLDGTLVWRNRTYAGFVFELPLDDDTYHWLIDSLTGTSAGGEDPSISSAA